MKIFISYTSSDKHWADWIGWNLRDAGHEPFVHEWEIGPGENIARWMEERVQQADRFLAVFSDAYIEAAYSQSERWAAYWEDPRGRSGFLIPIEVRKVSEWPTFVRPLKRLSLIDFDEPEARKRLDFLQPPKGPRENPIFPGRHIEEQPKSQPFTGGGQAPARAPRFPIVDLARDFLSGSKDLKFKEADALWRNLKRSDQLSLARRVLARLRQGKLSEEGEVGGVPIADFLCREEAILTSKDPDLSANIRHDKALKLLTKRFSFITNETQPGDAETLAIAGSIYKRRWNDLGQLKDLIAAAAFYRRGAECDMGVDAYPHIMAAFVEDLLAAGGDRQEERSEYARQLRERIVRELPVLDTWWNRATYIEALFGLGRYRDATEVLKQIGDKPESWQLRPMAEQLAYLAYLREERPFDVAEIHTFFETLLPGAAGAIRSMIIGKVGLALSGGGFRACFYHLGVLACLAERDILRDVEVLSCVSGGSIVGACYWLKLRQRWLQSPPTTRADFIQLVGELIEHFKDAVQVDFRRLVQPSKIQATWKVAPGAQGPLDPEKIAVALEKHLFRPLWDDARPAEASPIRMDELPFTPSDYNPALSGHEEFNPATDNWLRAHKVPGLILNATTINTGHAWHFTPTWMGESSWAIHDVADGIPRLEWSAYDAAVGWQIELSRAVAASACVPPVFEPLRLRKSYDDIDVSLVDGGVHDQGTMALLASDCKVILVSDACGQIIFEPASPMGVTAAIGATKRSMDALMERVRLANFADLYARRRSGLLRGLMFLHIKAGLESEVIRLPFSQQWDDAAPLPLTPSGVRREFQTALSELRTDLDAFTPYESSALMACGYMMASKALDDQLPELRDAWSGAPHDGWPFKDMLEEITSGRRTSVHEAVLTALREGKKAKV
jgi:predicted acylesterase/phospholipase RssA